MKKRFNIKKADEREQLELYKVEHKCFWVMLSVTFIILMMRILILEEGLDVVWGELVILLIGSIGLVIGTVKKGQGEMQFKTGFLISLISSAVFTVVFAIIRYFTLDYFKTHMGMLIIIALIMFVQIFVLYLIAFACMNNFAKKKRTKLEEMYENDDEENDIEE